MRARLWAALLGVSAWLEHVDLHDARIALWLDYLWEWTTVTPDTFSRWYETEPPLIEVGLGFELPADLEAWCARNGIPQPHLRALLEGTTEIVYGGLFAAVNHAESMRDLRRVEDTLALYALELPSASALPPSPLADVQGWGHPVTATQAKAIRSGDSAEPDKP